MTKILPLLLIIAMAMHLIRPFGLPGLKTRADVWKIAIVALVLMGATVLLSHSVS